VARDQRWGRIIESYGEDPFLVSELGVEEVRGIQEEHVVSTLKNDTAQAIRTIVSRSEGWETYTAIQLRCMDRSPKLRSLRDGAAGNPFQTALHSIECFKHITIFFNSTFASGSAAPFASMTVPWIVPVVIWVCALVGEVNIANTNALIMITLLRVRAARKARCIFIS